MKQQCQLTFAVRFTKETTFEFDVMRTKSGTRITVHAYK